MIAGASWTWWVGFHVAVIALLTVDALLPTHRGDKPATRSAAWIWTAVLALTAAAFAGWLALEGGRQLALEWVAGYTIETSLSIDNLFVFLVIFRGFRVSEQRQHTALLWGIGGAVVRRGRRFRDGFGASSAATVSSRSSLRSKSLTCCLRWIRSLPCLLCRTIRLWFTPQTSQRFS